MEGSVDKIICRRHVVFLPIADEAEIFQVGIIIKCYEIEEYDSEKAQDIDRWKNSVNLPPC